MRRPCSLQLAAPRPRPQLPRPRPRPRPPALIGELAPAPAAGVRPLSTIPALGPPPAAPPPAPSCPAPSCPAPSCPAPSSAARPNVRTAFLRSASRFLHYWTPPRARAAAARPGSGIAMQALAAWACFDDRSRWAANSSMAVCTHQHMKAERSKINERVRTCSNGWLGARRSRASASASW
jgi:hypothetical protein